MYRFSVQAAIQNIWDVVQNCRDKVRIYRK